MKNEEVVSGNEEENVLDADRQTVMYLYDLRIPIWTSV